MRGRSRVRVSETEVSETGTPSGHRAGAAPRGRARHLARRRAGDGDRARERRAGAARTVSETVPVSETPAGRLSDELRARLKADPASVAALPSDEKVALYREHGAEIGERVTIGAGALIDAEFVEIGDDTSIGEDVLVRARRFTIGSSARSARAAGSSAATSSRATSSRCAGTSPSSTARAGSTTAASATCASSPTTRT